jgi:hypothetical protein
MRHVEVGALPALFQKATSMRSIEATFQYLIYAPKGEVEGVLLQAAQGPLQLVLDKHDIEAAAAFDGISPGQTLTVRASEAAPSSKGDNAHPVYEFDRLEAVDGKKPATPKPTLGAAYRGTVVRINFARHGEANGVVLDSGDFIHTKPDGMRKLRLRVGDAVEADGDAQRLADDAGWAVEATRVNGKSINAH